MRKEFVITMSTAERQRLDQRCKETKTLLEEIVKNTEDLNERAELWEKIRNFNEVAKAFEE